MEVCSQSVTVKAKNKTKQAWITANDIQAYFVSVM